MDDCRRLPDPLAIFSLPKSDDSDVADSFSVLLGHDRALLLLNGIWQMREQREDDPNLIAHIRRDILHHSVYEPGLWEELGGEWARAYARTGRPGFALVAHPGRIESHWLRPATRKNVVIGTETIVWEVFDAAQRYQTSGLGAKDLYRALLATTPTDKLGDVVQGMSKQYSYALPDILEHGLRFPGSTRTRDILGAIGPQDMLPLLESEHAETRQRAVLLAPRAGEAHRNRLQGGQTVGKGRGVAR